MVGSPVPGVPVPVWYGTLGVVGTALVWRGSTALEQSSDALADHYGLPPIVKGAVILAIGSSFPELSSTVLSTLLHGDFDLGVGVVVGSAIFNILVIPAASRLGADELNATRDVVFKEALTYGLAIAVVLLVFAMARIHNPTDAVPFGATVTRPLALIPVGLYVLYVFLQYLDTRAHDATTSRDVDVYREWAVLAVSLALIVGGVEALVTTAIWLGDRFDTPSFLWGLTVVAVATSLPDAVVSVRASQAGEGASSLANVIGSNIFDLTVAIPAGVLLAGSTVVNFGAAVPMMGYLAFATVVLLTAVRTNLGLNRRESYALLAVYAVFISWMVAEATGVSGVVPGV